MTDIIEVVWQEGSMECNRLYEYPSSARTRGEAVDMVLKSFKSTEKGRKGADSAQAGVRTMWRVSP